jgi:hypothetical protein
MNPDHLAAIISFESAGSFSPSVRNAKGSGATGLIQFMPSTAARLGTSTDELAAMTADEQLDVVYQYFQPFAGRLGNLGDAYLAVFSPAGMGKGPDHVLYAAPSKAYEQNSGLDVNGAGVITNADVTRAVSYVLQHAQNFPRIEVLDSPPLPECPRDDAPGGS